MSNFTNFMARVDPTDHTAFMAQVDPTDHPAEAAILGDVVSVVATPVVGGLLTAGLKTMGSIGAAIKSTGAGGAQTVTTSNNNTIIVVVGALGIGILAYFTLR
jgi:hypothetical protein